MLSSMMISFLICTMSLFMFSSYFCIISFAFATLSSRKCSRCSSLSREALMNSMGCVKFALLCSFSKLARLFGSL